MMAVPDRIQETLAAQARQASQRLDIPPVTDLVLPAPSVYASNKYAKFGLLVIGGQACGFFYRLLDLDTRLQQEDDTAIESLRQQIIGKHPLTLVEDFSDNTALSREVAMAAINAITQWTWQKAGFHPQQHDARERKKAQTAQANTIGMVGFFGPMVKNACENGKKVVVLELDESLYQDTDSLTVTGDIQALSACDIVYCTASTLLNNSLASLLQDCPVRPFVLIGPSAGCFPDVLFEHGVSEVGGSLVVDVPGALARVSEFAPWQGTVSKFSLTAEEYPGFETLLDQAARKAPQP